MHTHRLFVHHLANHRGRDVHNGTQYLVTARLILTDIRLGKDQFANMTALPLLRERNFLMCPLNPWASDIHIRIYFSGSITFRDQIPDRGVESLRDRQERQLDMMSICFDFIYYFT